MVILKGSLLWQNIPEMILKKNIIISRNKKVLCGHLCLPQQFISWKILKLKNDYFYRNMCHQNWSIYFIVCNKTFFFIKKPFWLQQGNLGIGKKPLVHTNPRQALPI